VQHEGDWPQKSKKNASRLRAEEKKRGR